MDVVERGSHSLRRANKSWNIPMNSLLNHLNGKTRLKKGLANATHLNDRKTHLLLSWPLESMDPWTH
jgi:hypothetical protein